ncbi:unnamed protein product [Zymoseptoria tritici ST99CH_1A5]|uniref:Uncharacterized protein n=3 Tax=Zymoseptoria tritici TaxID=1047171 RepID=F9X5W6_ZYMTI|nr:uncharacterized protein MYCGRDRAFT_92043 [Zymoseptoria tritici IPO323]EGP89015.1 hypothetical protein MYCGRDRAFT_92043 [Zymoseptoria tritici IPO323]SMR49085.1 unnamed protein product [Zymoseptoria tritici ST99CH_1E4]SMR50262.1 unnamed protein product [Zymoseptoria tritici ST99CH_3D1]SMY22956.1 unnamed protein product [Zymoseptoria tritici ST99CH_1A5]
MSGEKKVAGKAAKVEDYDDEQGRAVPGTAVRASTVSQRPPPPSSRSTRTTIHRYSTTASDSGYSSHQSAPQKIPAPPAKPVEAPSRRNTTTNSSPSKSKPAVAVHNAPTRTSQPVKALPRHVSACDDPYCCDPNCERRYILPERMASAKASQPQYQQIPQYQYAPTSQATTMMPPPPRPRAESNSRAMPVSTYGYPVQTTALSQTTAPVVPPYHYQQYPLRPLSGHYGNYAPPSPSSPTYMSYPSHPVDPTTFSARKLNAALPDLDPVQRASRPVSGMAQISARQATQQVYADSESAEDSTSEFYTSEEERRPRRSKSRRRPQLLERSSPVETRPSRPAHKKYHTETSVPQRAIRESRPHTGRARHSDQDAHYLSSDARNDSDRTARADVGSRSNTYSSRSSRRSSLVTASSGRTKTTQSSNTDNTDYSTYEDRNGRRKVYLSEDERQLRRRQQQKRQEELDLQDRVAAYQRNTGGGGLDPHELTAENIRKKEHRKSASHVSGRSQKTSRSSNRDGGGDGGVKIQSGGTVLHVYGQASIEMRQDEDGGTAFVIGSSGKSYHGSKSSGSRSARERGRSDVSRRVIREEDNFDEAGYEIAR